MDEVRTALNEILSRYRKGWEEIWSTIKLLENLHRQQPPAAQGWILESLWAELKVDFLKAESRIPRQNWIFPLVIHHWAKCGNTAALVDKLFGLISRGDPGEDDVWAEHIAPYLNDLLSNHFDRFSDATLNTIEAFAAPHVFVNDQPELRRGAFGSSLTAALNRTVEIIQRKRSDARIQGLRVVPSDPNSGANLGSALQQSTENVTGVATELQASILRIKDDERFARLAIEEARKSVPEDNRPHPKVGAVVVKNGTVLSRAYRGESPKSHAEYIALEQKLPDDLVAGATVYTTLEPCTTRRHPKIPCAQRLVDRKVARVVIGMLDPNPDIRGRGEQLLSEANIETQLFPRDLKAQVEEMNREFVRAQKQKQLRTNTNQGTEHAAAVAARLLSDATRDLQKASWSFCALHTQLRVARGARDIATEEKRIMDKIDATFRVFDQDYDLPPDVSAVAKDEMGRINIGLANLKAFSTTGQEAEMKVAATQIQEACERIRNAARPYAYSK